jgi:GYF domain 2
MARERWFYAEGHRRMGPVARRELVEALLQLTDPRTSLIWRRGLHAWTPAADVPEVDELLASVAGVDTRRPAAPVPAPPPPPVEARRPVSTRPTRPLRPQEGGRGRAPLYAGGAVAVLVVGALAWLWWSRPAPPVLPGPGSTPAAGTPPVVIMPSAAVPTGAANAPTPVPGSTAATPAAAGGGQSGGAWIDREADLPPAELRRLRGVGGWTGDKLTVTLYNGSSWRVTEIFVLTSRMEGDRFVDAVAPQLLLPVGGAPLEGAVQDLLQKVAPDRKRAGLNPADTGPFEVVLGPAPAAYRWKIERAHGYPPRVVP